MNTLTCPVYLRLFEKQCQRANGEKRGVVIEAHSCVAMRSLIYIPTPQRGHISQNPDGQSQCHCQKHCRHGQTPQKHNNKPAVCQGLPDNTMDLIRVGNNPYAITCHEELCFPCISTDQHGRNCNTSQQWGVSCRSVYYKMLGHSDNITESRVFVNKTCFKQTDPTTNKTRKWDEGRVETTAQLKQITESSFLSKKWNY